MDDKIVIIDYTNHRGERSMRRITPTGIVKFSKTAYHPRMQWLLPAYDHNKGQYREFAMDHIHSWTPVEHIRNMPEMCPQCGRPKAKSADDIITLGACPKWYAVRDSEAEQDCFKTRIGVKNGQA